MEYLKFIGSEYERERLIGLEKLLNIQLTDDSVMIEILKARVRRHYKQKEWIANRLKEFLPKYVPMPDDNSQYSYEG